MNKFLSLATVAVLTLGVSACATSEGEFVGTTPINSECRTYVPGCEDVKTEVVKSAPIKVESANRAYQTERVVKKAEKAFNYSNRK